MNRVSLGGPVWLASDIHLGSHNPRTSDAFYEFLAHARQRSSALILLGDIFDVWSGDDWIVQPPDWLNTALEHLRLTAKTMPLWLMGGNRDFLVGAKLADSLGAHLIESPCILEVTTSQDPQPQQDTPDTQRFLLAHGDEFCTADRAYQRFRSVVRNPAMQTLFLALPLSLRIRIASKARASSMQTVRSPYDASYDVQDEALAEMLREEDLTTCIHGHTHRPGTYAITQHPGASDRSTLPQPMSRWVLPDWEYDYPEQSRHETRSDAKPTGAVRGGWMQIDQNGVKLIDLTHIENWLEQPEKNLLYGSMKSIS